MSVRINHPRPGGYREPPIVKRIGDSYFITAGGKRLYLSRDDMELIGLRILETLENPARYQIDGKTVERTKAREQRLP